MKKRWELAVTFNRLRDWRFVLKTRGYEFDFAARDNELRHKEAVEQFDNLTKSWSATPVERPKRIDLKA